MLAVLHRSRSSLNNFLAAHEETPPRNFEASEQAHSMPKNIEPGNHASMCSGAVRLCPSARLSPLGIRRFSPSLGRAS